MMGVIIEGLHDTSWENDEGGKITLMDLLNATEDLPVEKISVEELKPHLLTWDGDDEEVKKIESADLQYPILVFVNDEGEFITRKHWKTDKPQKVWGLLRCKNGNCRSVHNRDFNSASNMLNIGNIIINTGRIPNPFCRTTQTHANE